MKNFSTDGIKSFPKKKKFIDASYRYNREWKLCTSRVTANQRGRSWREKLCNWEQVSLRGGKEVGWFIDLSRGWYQDGIPRRRSKPFCLCCLFPDPFFAPSKASGFEISDAVGRGSSSLLSILPRRMPRRSSPRWAEGREVFGTKVVFPRRGRVWPASKFQMSFLWNLTPATSVKAHRPAPLSGALEGKLECKIETSLTIFALDEGKGEK